VSFASSSISIRASPSPGGRPRIAQEVRELIRRMSLENPLWGATKIHGELLKLGIEIAQSSIYMVPRFRSSVADLEDLS